MKTRIFNLLLLAFFWTNILPAQTGPIDIIHDAVPANPHLMMEETGGVNEPAVLQFKNSSNPFLNFSITGQPTAAAPLLGFNYNSASILAINGANEQVGVGTTAPLERLTVNGNIALTPNNRQVAFHDVSGTLNAFMRYSSPNLLIRNLGAENGGNMMLSTVEEIHFNTGAANLTRVWVKEDGKVGIGTATPLTKLDVNGPIHISGGAGKDLSVPSGRAFQFGHTNGSTYTERMRIDDNGYVGIGAESPKKELDVDGGIHISGGSAEDLSVPAGDNFQIGHYNGSTFTERLRIAGSGKVGIGADDPQEKLDVNGAIHISGGTTRDLSVPEGQNFQIGHYDGSTFTERLKIGPDGKIIARGEMEVQDRLKVVGSDLAERFVVNINENTSATTIQPGMVVSIDPERPGELALSDQDFDKKVAGIVSGAGGIKTAMLLGQEGTLADGDVPVAMTGRVYCWVDAGYGAVQPGDFLTTSDTPGHAMKVQDYDQARGAVLGKAMTALPEGKGLVLVLVCMQ